MATLGVIATKYIGYQGQSLNFIVATLIGVSRREREADGQTERNRPAQTQTVHGQNDLEDNARFLPINPLPILASRCFRMMSPSFSTALSHCFFDILLWSLAGSN